MTEATVEDLLQRCPNGPWTKPRTPEDDQPNQPIAGHAIQSVKPPTKSVSQNGQTSVARGDRPELILSVHLPHNIRPVVNYWQHCLCLLWREHRNHARDAHFGKAF